MAAVLPAMFIAGGAAALLFGPCGPPAALVAFYLAAVPALIPTKGLWRLRPRALAWGLPAMAALWALEALLPLPHPWWLQALASSCPLGRPALYAAAVALAPPVEEGIFRGLLYTELERRAGPAVGYVASSMAFAAIHGAPALVPLYFAVGLLLTHVFRRGGLAASALLHAANNLLALI